MFFQLGARQYNGLKSFISFGEESEAVVVEYALIGRKPRLQGTANSLTTINISLFFHQSFCNVKEEIDALKKSKSDYEILPLLAGSGEFYGDFVITSLSIDRSQMDDFGNTTGADVTVSLKENVKEDKQQQLQQTAAQNATATGNKQPVTKSKRQNPPTCNSKVSGYAGKIKSCTMEVEHWIDNGQPAAGRSKTLLYLQEIDKDAKNLAGNTSTLTCIQDKENVKKICANISEYAGNIQADIMAYSIIGMYSDKQNLDTAVRSLLSATHYNQVQAGAGK